MDRAAPREIPGPARIFQPACTEPSRSGLPSLPCSHHHSDTSFLHTLFIHYTFFPKWRNYSFRRRLPFYVIFILCPSLLSAFLPFSFLPLILFNQSINHHCYVSAGIQAVKDLEPRTAVESLQYTQLQKQQHTRSNA